jgi:hypothetical protein
MFHEDLPPGFDCALTPYKNDNPLNGVSTYDLVLIGRHILGTEPINSPYRLLAADANLSGTVTTADIQQIQKLILGIYQDFPGNTSWRFVPAGFQFENPDNPFSPPPPAGLSEAGAAASMYDADFVGIKVGDVNESAIPNNLVGSDERSYGRFELALGDDREVTSGEVFETAFRSPGGVPGFQFTLETGDLEVLEIVPGEGLRASDFAVFPARRLLTVSWHGHAAEQPVFTVRFRARAAGRLADLLAVSSRLTAAEAYGADGQRLEIALRFADETVKTTGFELYQNEPNPFAERTVVPFYLPEAARATLVVYDATGRVLHTETGDFGRGRQTFHVDLGLRSEAGLLYYRVHTAMESRTMKMVQGKP